MKARAAIAALLASALVAGPVPFWDHFVRVNGPKAPERAAQAWAESGFNPRAVSYVVGRDGVRRPCAYGLTQFTPPTWARYGAGKDPFDPIASIEAQARLMGDLEREFGDQEAAWGAYNAGPGSVRRALRRAAVMGYAGRDGWLKVLHHVTGHHAEETRTYVARCRWKTAEIRVQSKTWRLL